MSNAVLDDHGTSTKTWCLVGRLPSEPILQRINIPSAGATVGRSSRVADIVLPSACVSSRHARLIPTGAGVEVSDCGSRNGTYVRRKRIAGTQLAEAGDSIAFADAEFRLQADPSGELPAPQLGGTHVFDQSALEPEWTVSNFSRLIDEKLVRILMQPVVDLRTRRVIGLESLARSDIEGLETPARMFQAAEQLNQAAALSNICREKAIHAARGALIGQRLFLNTHAHENLSRDVLRSLDEYRRKLPSTHLVLEVGEDRFDELAGTRSFTRKLSQMRVELALSDFGAAKSRINEVLRLRPEYVKFHHSLITNIDQAAVRDQDGVKSLVAMLKSLNIRPVAEGVERSEEAEVCRRLGFELAQGFLFGRPAGIDELCMAEHSITGPAATQRQRNKTQAFNVLPDDE